MLGRCSSIIFSFFLGSHCIQTDHKLHSTFNPSLATSIQDALRYQHVSNRTRYQDVLQHQAQNTPNESIMHNLLPPRILSIMLSITSAKYLPMHARQAAPSSTPAVPILEQNPGCCLLSSALSVCTSLTSGFTTLAPSDQAPCLCYSSTVWAPDIFDSAVKTCADFASQKVSSHLLPGIQRCCLCNLISNA